MNLQCCNKRALLGLTGPARIYLLTYTVTDISKLEPLLESLELAREYNTKTLGQVLAVHTTAGPCFCCVRFCLYVNCMLLYSSAKYISLFRYVQGTFYSQANHTSIVMIVHIVRSTLCYRFIFIAVQYLH